MDWTPYFIYKIAQRLDARTEQRRRVAAMQEERYVNEHKTEIERTAYDQSLRLRAKRIKHWQKIR